MERKISRLEISEQQRVMERKLSNDLGFLCILESDKQKIIDNFEKQIGLSANLEDFSKLACSNNVSTFYLLGCNIYNKMFVCLLACLIACLFACLLVCLPKYWCLRIQIKDFS